MALHLFNNGLNWSGIHTCMISVFIVCLDTSAQSVEKLSLRVVGTLSGAAIGFGSMVFVIPRMSSGGQMPILIFLVSLAAG
jgi:multidrug resistance protein MdtO